MKTKQMKEELLDVSFNAMVLFKGLFALGEVIGGLLLTFIPLGVLKSSLHHAASMISFSPLAHLVVHYSQQLTGDATLFAVIYLLAHGLLKLIALALLWKKYLWSYPMMVVLLIGFMAYQMGVFFQHGAVSMLFLSLVDGIMVLLTLLEYKKMKGKGLHLKKNATEQILKMKKRMNYSESAIIVANLGLLMSMLVSLQHFL